MAERPARFDGPIVLTTGEALDLLAFLDEVEAADPMSILAFEAEALRAMLLDKLEG